MHRLNLSRDNLLHIAVLTLLTAIIYIPSLDVPFIFDDMPNIVLNLSVHAETPADLLNAFRSGVSGTRPLAMLSFAVNHLLTGLDVFGFHIFNIAIHILNALLLYLLLLLISALHAPPGQGNDRYDPASAKYAFWAAALWAVNPVQTQGVTYIVQRMTSMAAFFYLAGIYIFLLWRNGSFRTSFFAPAFLVIFTAGMACKETVITLPAALFLLDYIYYPDKFRKNLLPLATAAALMFILGLCYLQGSMPDWSATYPNRNFSPWERVMTQWRILWHYLSLFLFPLPGRLHLTYNVPVSTTLFSPWTTLAGLAAIIASLTLAVRIRKIRPDFSFGILFFFLAGGPEASFVNLELAFIHRLYLPSLFLPFAIFSLIPESVRRKTGVILIMLIALLSYWTITRNDEWNETRSFWQENIERGARTARAKNNTAAALIDSGRFTAALQTIDEGLEMATLAEDRKLLLYNRGYTLFYLNRHDESLVSFRKVADEFGAFRHTFLFIGLIYLQQGETAKVLSIINKLEEYEKLSYQGKILSANILTGENKFPEAEQLLQEALRNEARSQLYIRQRLQLELAKTYLKGNKIQPAYELFLEMTRTYPQNYNIWKMIYLMLESGGDKKSAEKVRDFLESKGVMPNRKAPPE
ncbi:MAG: hypothetical protein KKG47_14805 [Proteobacteria bacterium]|nr:hypothetical protein [Pseudomonadota bacterium]MBU1739838.1 hypothetical protein [Pseudomonadota bacterium]